MAAKPIPEGWHTLTPRLFVHNADRLVEFLKIAFGATERPRADERSPAEIAIGDSILIVSSAGQRAAMPAFLYVYVSDADATYRRAMKAGAKSIEEPQDMHYGDRRATVEDPFGNIWQIATHIEDVSPEELRRRLDASGQVPGASQERG
jgi:PhnB protein